MTLLHNLGMIAAIAITFAVGLPNVYPPKPKPDNSWTKADNDAMRSACPPISQADLGKHNRTSPLTLGLGD